MTHGDSPAIPGTAGGQAGAPGALAKGDLPKRIAQAAAALTLLISGAYAASVGGAIRYWDEQTYVDLARNLAAGHGYTQFNTGPTAYRPPGYPLILGALHWLGVGVVGYRLLNTLIFAATVYLVYLLARRLYSPWAGAVAAVITACYPLFIYAAGTLYPQTLAACLVVGGLLGVSYLTDREWSWRKAAGAGLVWGLLVLTVPTFAVVFGAACVWLLYRLRSLAVKRLAVLILCAALLPTSWCIRNAVQMHAFIPISTNNGINLLQGNSANATAGGGRLVDTSQYEVPAEKAGLDEVQVDDLLRTEAMDWISAHPARAATLYVEKFFNNFSYHNDYATPGQSSTMKDIASALSFYPLLLLLLIRIFLRRRRPAGEMEGLLITLVFLNALALAVFYTRLRFRIPADTFVIVVAAGTLVQLWTAWRSRRSGELAEPVQVG